MVEAACESHLRGKGVQMLEVNAMGEVQGNHDRPSQPGRDLTLTLDLDLQGGGTGLGGQVGRGCRGP